ncbi:MAG: hypothetical protein U5J82_08845 [Desulfobacterales bacterium]|nr:hypothetical protein [Desulfobacterales bacterium]
MIERTSGTRPPGDGTKPPTHQTGPNGGGPTAEGNAASIREGCFPRSFTGGGDTHNILEPLDLFVGLRYDNFDGGRRAAGHLVMVTGMVENLFDEDYEEEFGFPAPGQSFFIGVELTL